jgi:hypothetical protein
VRHGPPTPELPCWVIYGAHRPAFRRPRVITTLGFSLQNPSIDHLELTAPGLTGASRWEKLHHRPAGYEAFGSIQMRARLRTPAMPVTHSELFHSWSIQPGGLAAAAQPPGGGPDGSRQLFPDSRGDLAKANSGRPRSALRPGRIRRPAATPRRSSEARQRAGWGAGNSPEFFRPGHRPAHQFRHRNSAEKPQALPWHRESQKLQQSHPSQIMTALTLVFGVLVIMPISSARMAGLRGLQEVR